LKKGRQKKKIKKKKKKKKNKKGAAGRPRLRSNSGDIARVFFSDAGPGEKNGGWERGNQKKTAGGGARGAPGKIPVSGPPGTRHLTFFRGVITHAGHILSETETKRGPFFTCFRPRKGGGAKGRESSFNGRAPGQPAEGWTPGLSRLGGRRRERQRGAGRRRTHWKFWRYNLGKRGEGIAGALTARRLFNVRTRKRKKKKNNKNNLKITQKTKKKNNNQNNRKDKRT